MNGSCGKAVELYRPKFFTYGFRYLRVDISESGGNPLPSGTRFIQGNGDRVYFENTAKNGTKLKHHVHSCSMCGLNICSMIQRISPATVASLTLGLKFNCSMLTSTPNHLPVKIAKIDGEFVYSAAPIVGNFTSSEPMLNAIHAMIL